MMQAVLNTVNPIQTAIRSIFVTLDMGIYDLLKFMYELFFNIATNNLIDREMIFNIFSRVQLVIGIFVMFQLVMIVIKGIVNPDSFTDSKSGGAGSMVMRIIVALALLAVIVPINIPSPRNEYEKQINNNGLLFGTLYSLQYRVLANNTLGRLILGTENEAYTDGGTGIQDLSLFANRFTSTIVRMFYTLNTDDNGNYVCNDGFDSTYKTEGINPNIIIINGTQACGSGNFIIDTVYSALDQGQILKTGQQYRITMNWLSTIIGIVLVVLFFMMIFNVAKRVFKLAALQLIAPIPIISYMDPKGSKDGAFNSWVKMLATTYLELFVQLAVVYFSFAIINSFIVKFFSVNTVTSSVGNAFNGDAFYANGLLSWTFIIMTIALFIFAKDAPKFFKQALGIKTEGSFFDSFGQALGVGAVAAGAVSSGVAGAVSKYQNTSAGPDGKNKGKKIGAAILGGVGGAVGRGVSAGKEFFNSKDGNFRGIMEGNRKNAAQLYANAADDSTFKGRQLARLQSNIGLQNEYDKLQNKIKYYEEAAACPGRINQAFDGNGTYKYKMTESKNAKGETVVQRVQAALDAKGLDSSKYITAQGIVDSSGTVLLKHDIEYTLKDVNDILTRVQASGDATLITAVDEAKKAAQSDRLDYLRTLDREVIEKHVNDGDAGWSSNDLNAYDAAKLEYNIAQKYIDEPEFSPFKGKAFDSEKLGWGNSFKFSGGRTKESADAIKHSPRFSTASANAKRAQEAGKKK